MARTNYYTCDRCGARADHRYRGSYEGTEARVVHASVSVLCYSETAHHHCGLGDLCTSCASALEAELQRFMKPAKPIKKKTKL